MTTALYPGSFDPITYGHLDVIERAARLFDRVIIAVAHNADKKPLFTPASRVDFIRQCTGALGNIEVVSFEGLLVDFAKKAGATTVVRGLRAVTDFEYEFQMALMTRSGFWKGCPFKGFWNRRKACVRKRIWRKAGKNCQALNCPETRAFHPLHC